MRRRARQLACLALPAAAVCALGGCLQRRMFITSDPPGALVRMNDVDMGRTPLEVDFEWYGTYDIRLELDGYEPLTTSAKADAPVQEWPGIDLVTMALPVQFNNEVRWHFTLEPESVEPGDAIARGRELRGMMTAPDAEPTTEVDVEVGPQVEPEAESFPPLGGEEAPPRLEPVTEPIEPAPAEPAPES